MSLQHRILLGTTLVALCSVGFIQSANASPDPTTGQLAEKQQSEVQLLSQATLDDITTRVPGEIETIFGTEYVRVQLPDGETRLVAIPDDAFVTRRLVPGSDVILTMRGNRIIDIALASDEDLLALEAEMNAREQETVARTEVSVPETTVQAERVEQRSETTQRTQVAPTAPTAVRGMW